MSAARLTTYDARSLFAAAQEDAPGADERDAMFARLALATGIAAGAAAAASAASAAAAPVAATAGAAPVVVAASIAASTAAPAASTASTASTAASVSAGTFGMKLLALGALLGAASTALGVLLAVAVVNPDGARSPGERASARGTSTGGDTVGAVQTANAPARVLASGVRLAQPSARLRREASVSPDASAAPSPPASPREGSGTLSEPRPRTGAKAERATSDLDEEARLVTAARSALLAGEPARALALVQTTRKLSARVLEPEELGLEARALHALGRTDEAAATELVLRQRHPDHALAR